MRASPNHTYRLVWSSREARLVAVSEHAGSRRGKGRAAVALLATVLLGALMPAHAADLPTGGRVVAGSGSIAQSGNTMTITQGSAKMVADWQGFSIGQGRTVEFVQPSSSSAALNRVTGADPSVIQGSLRANGQVFLINPNGVLFTPTAQVNVGGLVASTLNLSNDDFMAGRHRFAGASGNAVVNAGNIATSAGGTVALIAARIVNTGTITAPEGHVLMGAGARVVLDLGGAVKIEVAEAAIDALVEQGGAIRADGGLVYLTARAAGDLTSTVINHSGVTEARTLATGKKGEIYLMGDMANGRVAVNGRLDASAPDGGNGGFIETSAAQVQVRDGARVSTLAARGRTGTWLVDPGDFEIQPGGGASTVSSIGAETLSTALGTTSVTLHTDGASPGDGDILVTAPVTWNAATQLSLSAHRNIVVRAPITAEHANGSVSLLYGQGSVAAGNTAEYWFEGAGKISLQAGDGKFSTTLGSDGATIAWRVITELGTAASTGGTDLQGIGGAGQLARNYVLGADIDAAPTAGWNSGRGFTPIGDGHSLTGDWFTGRFDGLGHAIANLRIHPVNGARQVGLFGYVEPSPSGSVVLRNLNLVNANVDSTGFAMDVDTGVLAGFVSGYGGSATVSRVTTSGNVSGKSSTGGVVGFLSYGADVIRSSSSANVSAAAAQWAVGGLVGYMDEGATVRASYATGFVTGPGDAGGLVGYSDSAIEHAFATGAVTGGTNAGGLVGGLGTSGQITRSYATGNVTASGGAAGGLVGFHDGSITHSWSRGAVTGATNEGGLVGIGGGTVTASFWDTVTSGLTGSMGGTGLTSAQMTNLQTFADAGWNITDQGRRDATPDALPWRIYDGQTPPLLRHFFRDVVTVTPNVAARAYDGTDVVSGSVGVQAGADASLVRGTATFTADSRHAGTRAVTVNGLHSNQLEYDLDVESSTVVITPKAVTVRGVTASNKVFDGTTNASVSVDGAAVSGAVAGDVVNVTSGSVVGAFADAAVGVDKSVTVSGLALSGADAANYRLDGVDPVFASINAAATDRQSPSAAPGSQPAIDFVNGQSWFGQPVPPQGIANFTTTAEGWSTLPPEIVVIEGGIRLED